MLPEQTGQNYDKLAQWWQEQHQNSTYGLNQFSKAISFAENRGKFIDIGCGSSGRFISAAIKEGFAAEGLDISKAMIEHAQKLHPGIKFYSEDVCSWNPSCGYDLISAWDSIFHLPKDQHQPVITKLCRSLNKGGVLIFTCGAEEGEAAGGFEGQLFEYSSLGSQKFVELLGQCGCETLHLEHDQFPESHVYIVARKINL